MHSCLNRFDLTAYVAVLHHLAGEFDLDLKEFDEAPKLILIDVVFHIAR